MKPQRKRVRRKLLCICPDCLGTGNDEKGGKCPHCGGTGEVLRWITEIVNEE